jgi:tellurite resistance protein
MSDSRPPAMVPPRAQSVPAPTLQHFPLSFFAVVMGLAGLALAWLRAHAVLAAPVLIGQVLVVTAAAVYVVTALAYARKGVTHRSAVRAELTHPVRLPFSATVTIALLLVATGLVDLAPGLALALWWIGAAGQLAVTLLVLRRWSTTADASAAHVTPAWFIPVVGNLVVPLAGVRLGQSGLSEFFWSFGLIFWIALLPVVLTRLFLHEGSLPPKLQPTTAILVAPPAVAYLSLLRLDAAAGDALLGRALFGGALFFALFVLSRYDVLRKAPFAVSWWAYSFPAAALSTAVTARVGQVRDVGWFARPLAWTLLALVTVLIVGLIVRTLLAMRSGHLFVAE